jgi:hypothetical protein
MAKTIKASNLNKAGISKSCSIAGNRKWELSAGRVAIVGSSRSKMYKMYDKMQKNKSLSANMTSNDTNSMAQVCLASLNISYKIDRNPKRTLLDEEDSSNQITNTKIVDTNAIDKLERKKTNKSDRFGDDSSDPWYQPDMASADYLKKLTPSSESLQTPDLTSVVGAIYSVNEIMSKKGLKLNQL